MQHADSVERAVDTIENVLGPITLLVNNAGINRVAPVHEQPVEDFDAVLDVNLRGVFICSHFVSRRMVTDGIPGSIVNIGSVAGIEGFPGRSAYAASKAGVHHLTRVMALDLAPHRIRVNGVAPGYVRTDLIQGLLDDGTLDAATLLRRIPLGEFGESEDVAAAVSWLGRVRVARCDRRDAGRRRRLGRVRPRVMVVVLCSYPSRVTSTTRQDVPARYPTPAIRPRLSDQGDAGGPVGECGACATALAERRRLILSERARLCDPLVGDPQLAGSGIDRGRSVVAPPWAVDGDPVTGEPVFGAGPFGDDVDRPGTGARQIDVRRARVVIETHERDTDDCRTVGANAERLA